MQYTIITRLVVKSIPYIFSILSYFYFYYLLWFIERINYITKEWLSHEHVTNDTSHIENC
jgi:hypothetical protein